MLKEQLVKFNNQVKSLTEKADSEDKQRDLLLFLKNGASALIKLYPEDFQNLLKERNIAFKVKHLSEVAEIMDSELESYKIDDSSGKLAIKLQDNIIIQESLFDIGKFLQDRLNIKPEDDYFYLFLGFFCEEKNYEIAQFYETAIKISE
jgi:hypothetical protein